MEQIKRSIVKGDKLEQVNKQVEKGDDFIHN